MGAVGACYAAAIGYPVYRYLASPALEAAAMAAVTELSYDIAQLPAPGTGRVFAFGAAKVLVIHYVSGDVKAFSAVCTHLGCTVEYQPDQERIHCACHQGVYDMNTGLNVAGPPPSPLRPYYIEVGGDGFVIRREPRTDTREQE
jgi:Rieske Fe-S protein